MSAKHKLTKRVVSIALARAGNVSAAADRLGVARCTVQRAMRRYGLSRASSASHADPLASVPNGIGEARECLDPAQHAVCVDEPNPPPVIKRFIQLEMSAFSGPCLGDVGRRRHW